MYLEQEIAAQPTVLQRLLSEETTTANQIAAAIRDFNPAFVHIAARGTSDNAARYAQYLFGAYARLPVALATPSLHTLYATPPNLGRAAVLGISQSGQSEDVCQVLTDAREQGALTVAITNDPASPMAQTAAYHLHLGAGEEKSVAATKTYTAQLTAMAMLVTALVDDAEQRAMLAELPRYASQTLTDHITGPLRDPKWVERYRYMDQFAVIGRGFNYCTAFEINLKVKELCYITGDAYSEADFRHGPIAVVGPGFPVLVIAPKGKAQGVILDLIDKLHEKQAELIVVSNDDTAFTHAQNTLRLPVDIPEWLSPVVAVLHGQVFAMRLAIAKGYAVDQPRGLTKVTVTR
ncbi:MAG: SIS domain-containing protein [Anaerolineae bacterium]|nr:SIS domain-containing protein [Anaerolineae bacterium]